ncbi:DUF2800 domain-containing protein [Hyphomicrobium sp. DY-1]|uniref:DUF2800 domain-containing protein n=1 Tax=Hyphomicrobium sp. DY-1 TaxID=3075650 RepID=UPI0039C0C577
MPGSSKRQCPIIRQPRHLSSPKAHSAFGASSAYRWTSCPGSVRLCDGLPNTSSAYAQEGTAAHALAEHCLKNMEATATPYVGQALEDFAELSENDRKKLGKWTSQKLGDVMAGAVNVYLDAIYAVFDAATDELNVEERFTLSHIGDDLFGTNDCSVYKPGSKTLYIFDYKHGAGVPVEVVENPQLLYYALGAAMRRGNRPLSKVVMTIVQPRCPHHAGPVRADEVDALQLIEWGEDLRDAVARARDPNAPLASGKHCRFCPAAGICPQLEDTAVKAAMNEFDDVPSLDTIPQLSGADLAAKLKLAGEIETWLKAVRKHAYEQARHGNMPDGFKFVAKVAKRKWRDTDAAYDLVQRTKIADIRLASQIKTPAQLEQLLGKATFALLADEVVQESSGVNLVPVTHKAPAVSIDAASEFDDIDWQD